MGFPFDTVTERQVAAGTDIFTFQLAYQMMRDAKMLPSRRFPCVSGDVVLIASNAQRTTPMYVRVRANLDKTVATPWMYLGTDSTQTQAGGVLDRLVHNGQIEFLLYPGQELYASYFGDAKSVGEAIVSVSSLDEAVALVKRATGQVQAT